jgi:murein DD-endopeptidase MepM/ murein hydrolase activator NlpD
MMCFKRVASRIGDAGRTGRVRAEPCADHPRLRSDSKLRLAIATMAFAALIGSAQAGDLRLEGSFTQGGLVIGTTTPGAEVRFEGVRVRVSPEGLFLIGFDRDAAPTARLEVSFPDRTSEQRLLEVAGREYQVQRIDGLPPSMVTPSEADLERIRAEQQLINAARWRDTATPYFTGGFEWPVVGPISGVYGSQRILNGEPRQPHYGVDVAVPAGTPVRAPADGVVSLAHDDMYYTGGTVMIDHGHGLSSMFLHMSRVLVEDGQALRQGDPIGEVGATGRATGPHLDWRMNLFGRRIDVALVAGPMPKADEAIGGE